jgi:NAD(P)-dependent dehydrogenase (short-subunit alcohol dehydrogenase family)
MILITGASRGIGKYLFDKFISEGEKVYGTYLRDSEEYSVNEKYFQTDVTDYLQVEEFVQKISSEINKLTLINCAGNNYNSFAHKSSPEEWKNVILTNLVGTYNMIRAVLPVMREQSYGRIINFASVVAETGIPGTSAYAASKSGLWGMTRSIAVENASKGITINNLNLGYFDIGMINEVSDEYQKIIKEKIPSGKFGDPKNIYNAVKFIMESEYLNGSSIDVNGGIV